jgi:hypothetical protein
MLFSTQTLYKIEISPVHYPVGYWIFTWIGLRDSQQQTPHEFAWTDGTPFDYENWAAVFGHPSPAAHRNCGFMCNDHNTATSVDPDNYRARWGNDPCDATAGSGFVCVCKRSTSQS